MKNMKLLLCMLCMVILCCSCGWFGDQEYICEFEKVKSIEIVRLENFDGEKYEYEYTVLAQITDKATFVDRLNKVETSINWGEPRILNMQELVIRIEYFNGDYDLMNWRAQNFYHSGTIQIGYFVFDDEEFNALISDYMPQ